MQLYHPFNSRLRNLLSKRALIFNLPGLIYLSGGVARVDDDDGSDVAVLSVAESRVKSRAGKGSGLRRYMRLKP